MRILLTIGIIFGVVGIVAYIKRRDLADWASSFLADRIAHALNNPEPDDPNAEPSEVANFAKTLGKKVLNQIEPSAILKRL